MSESFFGYAGQLLYADLSSGDISTRDLSLDFAREWVGGNGFGAQILYDKVLPGVEWDHPENRIVLASGPLGATKVGGSGLFSLIFKGPMTNVAGATQASGFLGAFLKLSGFDAVVFEGAADDWCYLYVHDGQAELRDARHLLGKDTWETEASIAEELGVKESRLSVFSIGPAGENLVRFAGVLGDKGHAACHNGVGAVWGAKKLKAVAVARGSQRVMVHDKARLNDAVDRLFESGVKSFDGVLYTFGTGGDVLTHYALGQLPIKNYTTNILPGVEKITGQRLRTHYEIREHPCWACRLRHVKFVKVTEGPYAGFEGEEPEYECIAAWGSQIGNTDLGAVVMLSNLADRLGIDSNEGGWLVGWVMECYEKSILSRDDLDGLDMSWGNAEAVTQLLHKIAQCEGCGDWLAEGVMRASAKIGEEAARLGVYTLKGSSPRGHDHRAWWSELLDTCTSSTGTNEASPSGRPDVPNSPTVTDPFDPEQITAANAASIGWRQFGDCLGACRYCLSDYQAVMDAFNAVTGWEISADDAIEIGQRVTAVLRAFNYRHGLDPTLEAPSPRYQSTPADGPFAGRSIAEHFDWMKKEYRRRVGWDSETGKPLPETLERLGLADLIPDLWPGADSQ